MPLSSDERLQQVVDAQKGLLNNSTYSDLKIVCRDKIYHVHKAVVCPRPSFFRKACATGFGEAHSGEITLHSDDSDLVKMDDPQLVDYMVTYLYCLDYLPLQPASEPDKKTRMCRVHTGGAHGEIDIKYGETYTFCVPNSTLATTMRAGTPDLLPPPPPPITPETDVTIHSKMYALGDFYGIPGLKAAAAAKFEDAA
ncbi:hypothetical protein NA57DRAFT_50659 [Rhizodiscina lignyota]|uniref:BTB domain-containing protein n=1 Tax=Rhizodiscina lignyota TaxID=1504668 RepID=A0A9P4ILL9_9PEZI|nr:hypothetical protein NA57DRAFT_50659 [Rhizodiscina lignyota]